MLKPKKYEDVLFMFVNMDVALELSGTVIVRHNAMAIDIPLNGKSTYVVTGSAQDGFYDGRNSSVGAPRVYARWTKFGPIFAGRWLEEGVEYLFSFRLP